MEACPIVINNRSDVKHNTLERRQKQEKQEESVHITQRDIERLKHHKQDYDSSRDVSIRNMSHRWQHFHKINALLGLRNGDDHHFSSTNLMRSGISIG